MAAGQRKDEPFVAVASNDGHGVAGADAQISKRVQGAVHRDIELCPRHFGNVVGQGQFVAALFCEPSCQ